MEDHRQNHGGTEAQRIAGSESLGLSGFVRDSAREDGVALIVALLATALMTALAVSLALIASLETTIAGNFRTREEGLAAADAAVERAMDDLQQTKDWNPLLAGLVQSSFADGPPGGTRTLPGGATINLTQATNLANCQNAAGCSESQLNGVTSERPWGLNNPRWQLYAYGPMDALLPGGAIASPYYIAVWVGDEGSENDNDPLSDGADARTNPGAGVIGLRAEAFGPRMARVAVEVTVAHTQAAADVRILSWRLIR